MSLAFLDQVVVADDDADDLLGPPEDVFHDAPDTDANMPPTWRVQQP
jgi:hypothetical protein